MCQDSGGTSPYFCSLFCFRYVNNPKKAIQLGCNPEKNG